MEKQVYQKATQFHIQFCSSVGAVKLSQKQQQSRLGTRVRPSSHCNTLTPEAVIRWTVPQQYTQGKAVLHEHPEDVTAVPGSPAACFQKYCF